MMHNTMGSIPPSIEKATDLDGGLLYEHLQSRSYAMPAEGAFSEETRTLIYLALAAVASSTASLQAMASVAKAQGISQEKVLETIRIVWFALATKIIGDAGSVFDVLLRSN